MGRYGLIEPPFPRKGKIWFHLKLVGIHCTFQDPEDFQVGYDEMIMFVKNKENWKKIEEDLRGRGVSKIL
jgi:hypothetical protein